MATQIHNIFFQLLIPYKLFLETNNNSQKEDMLPDIIDVKGGAAGIVRLWPQYGWVSILKT